MNIRGYFMLLMSTIWRTVVTQLKATFRYRVAGGSDNALLPERKGRAVFKKVYGNTVKWNQLHPSNYNDTVSSGVTVHLENGIYTCNNTINTTYFAVQSFSNSIGFHYLSCKVLKDTNGVLANASFKLMNRGVSWNIVNGVASAIYNNNSTEAARNRGLGFVGIVNGSVFTDVKFAIKDHNLTAIFGTDAEIAAALGITTSQITQAEGVAAFEAWLALNVGAQDYHPYDGGSLVSFKGQGVKVTGWNKFHVVNGSGVADVKKDVKYYVAGPFGSLHYSDGTAISVASDRTFTAIKDDTITFGSVSNSIVLNIYTGTAKDGTYEPYHEEIVDLSGAYINVWDEVWEQGGYDANGVKAASTHKIRNANLIPVLPNENYYLKYSGAYKSGASFATAVYFYDANKTFIGKYPTGSVQTSNAYLAFTTPSNAAFCAFSIGDWSDALVISTYNHDICINVSNADINGTYYPHALQSAGSVTDEDTATELTKKVGVVDLGTLTWVYNTTYNIFYSNGVNSFLKSGQQNAICDKYANPNNTSLPNMEDKTVTTRPAFFSGNIIIKDTAYTNSSTFKTAMNGVMLNYELATPIVIPHDTPMQYAVDKYSTEELLVPASVAGEPTSTAIVADIEYQAR